MVKLFTDRLVRVVGDTGLAAALKTAPLYANLICCFHSLARVMVLGTAVAFKGRA